MITKEHGKIFKTLISLAFDDFPDLVLESWIRSVLSVITSQPVHLRLALSTMVMCFKCKSHYLKVIEVKNRSSDWLKSRDGFETLGSDWRMSQAQVILLMIM